MLAEPVEVVSDLARLRALGKEWNALAERFASPFLRHEWNLACAEAFDGSLLRLAVHVLRSGGRIAAIAPLALVYRRPDGGRKPGVRRLEMLSASSDEPGGFLYRDEESLRELLRHVLAGARPIHLVLSAPSGEPGGFLYRDDASLRELAQGVLAGRRPLNLWQLDSDGLEARLLRELMPRSAVCLSRDAGAAYWMPLGPSWRDVEARIPAKRRSDLRRERKHAEKLGEVRFEAITADEGNVDRYLEEFFRVEAAGWKARSGTAILSMPHARRFYTLYGRAAARLGLLRFYFLRIGGEAAAATIMVDHGNRLWGLKIGYDERFRRVSPGILLAHEVLRHACERGYEAAEFLGGSDRFKAIWMDRRRHYCSIRVYPLLSPLGGIALGQDLGAFVGRRAGRVLRRIRPRSASVGLAPAARGANLEKPTAAS